jgi:hypothetical protein
MAGGEHLNLFGSTPHSWGMSRPTNGGHMYIGGGILTLILLIVILAWLL